MKTSKLISLALFLLLFVPAGAQQPQDMENGHEYVDLGLSVNWATCNVGANKPEGYGGYYAWGETEEKETLGWTNYRFRTSGGENVYYNADVRINKYNWLDSCGVVDNKTILDLDDDVAHVLWRGTWRMPTPDEFNELRDYSNCTWTWTTLNGVKGNLITSKRPGYEGRSIFLPAAGWRVEKSARFDGSQGCYWSRSLSPDSPLRAWMLRFNDDWHSNMEDLSRCSGYSIRPVCPNKSQDIQEDSQTPEPKPQIVFPSEAETGPIIKRGKGSITFWVDGELPDPKLYRPGSASPGLLIGDSIDQMVFKCSYDDDSEEFIYFEKPDRGASFHYSTPFFNGMIDAFAYHNPVVLSPDVLWMLVCQGFSHYVNENSETMRDVLVDFSGRRALSVSTAQSPFSKDFDWAAVTADFTRQMRSNVKKKEVVDMVLSNFSTTGDDELITSRITLMNSMQKFFEFRMDEVICGIPYVTLQGTPDDWKKFAGKVRQLRDYGLDWWADQLEPIAAEFVKASQGNPDREFWKNIVKKTRPGEIRGYGCIPMGGETKFDGWFLKFLPFTENGMTPSEVCMDDKMLSELCKTDFTYQQVDGNGKIIGSMPMKLWGGIVGCQQDEESSALSFKIGWMASFDITGVDCDPQFPGGDEALKQYIRERVRMPEEIRKAAAETDSVLTINVGFLIDRDGTILESVTGGLWWYRWYKSQRGIEDNLDEELENAVKAAIESMPKWQPATYGGIAVPLDKDIKVEF